MKNMMSVVMTTLIYSVFYGVENLLKPFESLTKISTKNVGAVKISTSIASASVLETILEGNL